jgi:ParB/RepB/Spo0J family partition protein
MNVTEIPTGQLVPHPHNVRRDIGDVTELAASITGVGLLQPLTVAPVGEDEYVVIAGHRRLAAAKKAGLATVPCLVRHDLVNRVDQLEAMLTENLQRTDLTVMEEAAAYEQLTLLGVKPAEIAKSTGRSRGTVDSRLRLMALPEKAKHSLDVGQLTLADADLLLKHVDDEEVMKAADGKSGRDLHWAVEHVLRERQWAKEREKRKTEQDTAPAKRKESAEEKKARLAREAVQAQHERRRQLAATSDALQKTWILERIALDDTALPEQVARLVLDQLICDHEIDVETLHAIGFTPIGEDDDEDDWWLSAQAKSRDLPAATVHLALALDRMGILNGYSYWLSSSTSAERLARLVEFAGYSPAEAERELLGEGEQS